jgi:hypothetical protein
MGREAKFPTTGDSSASEGRQRRGTPSVFVTSAQANRSAAHSRIASPNQETLCWSNRRRSTEIIGLVGAIVYAMLGEQLFLLEL